MFDRHGPGLVLLIEHRDVDRGITTVHARNGTPLDWFTPSAPLDAALVDDARVHHGVTPIVPIDPNQPTWRDVPVVTFRAMPATPATANA
ncbi:2OG-Fe dioxygenase family protein [Metallibacterium sp.]|uniref:2OG-Fe dioxygenase family protein n=1 Tax=Metallibacterium sp. TaxID=2940281 RepID=UPI002623FE5F|nr:2OG-Fe dioxygenase family protein [Metallibacterium sp.]